MKPKIAIIGNQYEGFSEVFHNHQATFVSQFFLDAIYEAGGIPAILPVIDFKDIPVYVDSYDGFLLTGGQGVSPFLYGEDPLPNMGQTSLIRDKFELEFVKQLKKIGKPILGVCRGMQVINVALGGSLYQNINFYYDGPVIKHLQVPTKDTQATHLVSLKNDTYLSEVFGDKVLVNSLHQQAIKQISCELEVIAHTSDGIIEAVQSIDKQHKIFGVQWHPEMLFKSYPKQLKIFERLVRLATDQLN